MNFRLLFAGCEKKKEPLIFLITPHKRQREKNITEKILQDREGEGERKKIQFFYPPAVHFIEFMGPIILLGKWEDGRGLVTLK